MQCLLFWSVLCGGVDIPVGTSGELRTWHTVTLTFDGPDSSETATPNPFTDYRLQVTFTGPARQRYVVPGFYAADGNAAQTSATKGNKWRVRFTPDQAGEWTYRVSFREGKEVAVALDADVGKPGVLDGLEGKLMIEPADKKGREAKGRLAYVGEHYLRFAGSGERFLKGGADSPENFLAYADFDDTFRLGKGKSTEAEASKAIHRYEPHVKDWREGDPLWQKNKGKGIIGALNYLAAQGMNSVYFVTFNIDGGDGMDVWPWRTPTERLRFDVSKLEQWEIVFAHMDRLGIMLHVVTQEQENDQALGGLSLERKLYYRELVARFGHHLALTWNLGEENTNTDKERQEFAGHIRALDPYAHPIVVHTFPGEYDKVYNPLLGFKALEGVSLQTNATREQTKRWVDRSREAKRPWVVCLDEIGPAAVGVKPDAEDPGHDEVRKLHLWGNLMAGGAGVEWYFGYKHPHNDLNCEDWRSREKLWRQTRIALDFFQEHLPFWKMRHADELTSAKDDYVFALPGEVYAVYLPNGGSTKIDMPKGSYRIDWYDPRDGGALQAGSEKRLSGGGEVSIGASPAMGMRDWVVLIRREK